MEGTDGDGEPRLTVNQKSMTIVGSNPTSPTKYSRLAQMARALALQARCREFKSHTDYQKIGMLDCRERRL